MELKRRIDRDLLAIGRNRQWLAAVTGYSYFTVRDSLAPSKVKLSNRMAKAFTRAIDNERIARANHDRARGRIAFAIAPHVLAQFHKRARAQNQTLATWILNQAIRAKPNPTK